MSNKFEELLQFGNANERKAYRFLKDRFENQIESVQFIEYNKEDNSKQQLYGDIQLKTTYGRTIHFEVKSRKKTTDCLCFEITESKVLKPKFVDYYLILIPELPILMLDYFCFQSVYPSLPDKPVRHNDDGEAIIFIPISEIKQAIDNLNGFGIVA